MNSPTTPELEHLAQITQRLNEKAASTPRRPRTPSPQDLVDIKERTNSVKMHNEAIRQGIANRNLGSSVLPAEAIRNHALNEERAVTDAVFAKDGTSRNEMMAPRQPQPVDSGKLGTAQFGLQNRELERANGIVPPVQQLPNAATPWEQQANRQNYADDLAKRKGLRKFKGIANGFIRNNQVGGSPSLVAQIMGDGDALNYHGDMAKTKAISQQAVMQNTIEQLKLKEAKAAVEAQMAHAKELAESGYEHESQMAAMQAATANAALQATLKSKEKIAGVEQDDANAERRSKQMLLNAQLYAENPAVAGGMPYQQFIQSFGMEGIGGSQGTASEQTNDDNREVSEIINTDPLYYSYGGGFYGDPIEGLNLSQKQQIDKFVEEGADDDQVLTVLREMGISDDRRLRMILQKIRGDWTDARRPGWTGWNSLWPQAGMDWLGG